MFITTQGFKRLINEAYKGIGLHVGNDGSGYYLSGGFWAIWIQHGCLPKKELASIIELTGELPSPGEAFKATKEGNQYELPWNDIYAVMDNAEHCDDRMEVTALTMKYASRQQARILQNLNSGKIILINDRFVDIIDNSVVQYKDGEDAAVGPLISGRHQGVFYKNNIMALHIMHRTDDKNKRLLGFLETFDITEGGKNSEHRLFGHGIPETNPEEKAEETQEEHP